MIRRIKLKKKEDQSVKVVPTTLENFITTDDGINALTSRNRMQGVVDSERGESNPELVVKIRNGLQL